MSSAWYNVIVIGTELPGLIYAALAARHGYRVGVIGNRASTNTYRHQGHVFLYEPERYYGFNTSPVIERVMSDLFLSMEMKNRPKAVDPTLQVVTQDLRLDVVGRSGHWVREIEREMPRLKEQLLAFEVWAASETRASNALLLENMVLPHVGARKGAKSHALVEACPSLAQELAGVTPGPVTAVDPRGPFASLVGAPLSHLSGISQLPSSVLSVARLWTHLKAGVYRLPNGLDGLKGLFLRKLKEQCGDYRPKDMVERIIFKRGKVREVLLADRAETLGCDLLVANMSRESLHKLIPDGKRSFREAPSPIMAPVTGYRMVVNVAVDPKVIPVGMAPELVLVDEQSHAFHGKGCLWISRPGMGPYASREGRPSAGVMQVTATLPVKGRLPTRQDVQQLMSGVLSQLRTIIPWFDEHLHAVHTPCLVQDAMTGETLLDPSQLTPIYAAPYEGMLGVGTQPSVTKYKTIFLSGSSIFSGLGLEGAFLGALQTLALTRKTLKIRNTLA